MSFLQRLKMLFRKKTLEQPKPLMKSSVVITSRDIKAIAGDDVMATQLDLAQAYIEMGKKSLAKKILEHVEKNGSVVQQQEAHILIHRLTSR